MVRWRARLSLWFLLVMVGVGPTAAGGDLPVVGVSRQGLTPDRIEVHVGELVRWQAAKGLRLRLEFDPHRDAHELIERRVRSARSFAILAGTGTWHRSREMATVTREES